MKRTKSIVFAFVFLLTFGSVMFIACKKTATEDKKTPNYRAASDNSMAELVFGGAFSQEDKAQKTAKSMDTSSCPAVSITGSNYPYTYTIDFGSHCVCSDSRIRSGKIISVIDKPYLDSTSHVVSTFNNYYETINNVDYHLEGTQTITNIGHNSLGHPIYTVVVQDGSVSSTYGTIHWISNRQNEFIAGYDTWVNPFDDAYLVTGSSSGTDINGSAFQVNIVNPLLWQFNCWYVKSGSIEIVNSGYPTITVDYGNGACDNIATVSWDNTTITISM